MNLLHSDISVAADSIELGDSNTFDLIYQRYFRALCYFSERFIGDHAEDIIHSLFLKLWNKKESFESLQHCQSYLYVAAKNACLDFLKSQHRTVEREIYFQQLHDYQEEDIENEIIRAEYWAEIYREINALPTQCSTIIKLSFIEGLNNAQIAEILNISDQTVKNQKVKGIKALRFAFAEQAPILLFISSLFKL